MTLGKKAQVRVPRQKRIAFLGDSITEFGGYIRYMDAHILKHMPEHRIELIDLGVSSETAAGTSEKTHPFPRPCVHERLERALAESRPEWVVICYGMNDGIYHPLSEERMAAYKEGMTRVVAAVQAAGAEPILMTPPPFDVRSIGGKPLPAGIPDYSYDDPYEHYDNVLQTYGNWLQAYGDTEGLLAIDIHTPLRRHIDAMREADPGYRYGDGVHPGEDGHWIIARTILAKLLRIELEQEPAWVREPDASPFHTRLAERRAMLNAAWREHVGHTNPYKLEALPLAEAERRAETMLEELRALAAEEGGAASVRRSEWNGYERLDYYADGREAILVAPKKAADGRPWVWRTEFFGAFADADTALLAEGWHIACCRISNLYGCPESAELMERFRQQLVAAHGLSAKPVLFGFSRGGLYALRYAGQYPAHAAALYLDAPVVDIRSWPGGEGAGSGSPGEWEDCLRVYGLPAGHAGEAVEALFGGLAAAAKAGIPLLIVAGDADRVVPLAENGSVLADRYRAMGGEAALIVKPGVDHHPHSLSDPAPIVSFARENHFSS